MTLNLTLAQIERAIWLQTFASKAQQAGIVNSQPHTLPPWLHDPTYKPSDTRWSMYIINAVSLFAATYTVFTRIYTRIYITRNFGSDDWFIVFAMVLCAAFGALQFCFLGFGGVGRHIWDVSPDEIYICFKLIWLHLMSYILVVFVIKLSILCLYRRIIPREHGLQRVIWAFLVLHTIYFIVAEFIFGFQCGVSTGAWNIYTRFNKETKCMDLRLLFYIFGSIHVCLDFVLLFLPLKVVWQLNVPKRKKSTIFAMFILGIVACLCPIMRMVSLHYVFSDYDLTWNVFQPGMWGCLEVTIGVIIASIPPSKLFHEHLLARLSKLFKRQCPSNRSTVIFEIPREEGFDFIQMRTPTPAKFGSQSPYQSAIIHPHSKHDNDCYNPFDDTKYLNPPSNRTSRISNRIASMEDLERASAPSSQRSSVNDLRNVCPNFIEPSISALSGTTFGPSSPWLAKGIGEDNRDKDQYPMTTNKSTFGTRSPLEEAHDADVEQSVIYAYKSTWPLPSLPEDCL